jgi:F-type H+-transporting ATPase subunit delta
VATAAAKRYGRAVFQLASEEKHIDEWRQRLAAVRDLLSDQQVAAVLSNPTIATADRMKLVSNTEVLDTEASNLVGLLIEGHRIDQAAAIADEFDRLANEAAGRVNAVVTTAVELGAEEQRQVGAHLSKLLAAEVSVQSLVDPRILGGLKVQYGDHLIDASVATRLQQLRRTLTEAS